ncbi:MAG: glutamine--tRNA ligase/YqeY domain fusion protein [Deltaproteobacteria bacterium]|nr:glutamine--tRNA ligase/YqeY domain fusion protein [Deltaproteobacteria bacterium]
MDVRARSHFLTDIIDADRAASRHGGLVRTRFPPEPNGYLHIGHSKAIALNFGLARQYQGACNLRMDDTNPVTEDVDYVQSIERDVAWLGGRWDGEVRFASDYFPEMYALAERLVREGKAYVDSQTVEEIRAGRGDFNRPGTDSPFRNRSVDENLDLLRRMRAGDFADGAHVLRARIDMAHPNVLMRDPLLYRIRHAHHHRSGDAWPIYPMYDYAHPLEDAIEGITHSICTLEFETNRELYDWVVDHTGPWDPRPRQYEFARLALGYTVMSKRKLLQLVKDGHVEGWDDPRMPTLAGIRRRGVPAEALLELAEMVGVAKHNSLVDIGKLEFCIRGDLERRCKRALAVLDPLPLTLTNWPDDLVDSLSIPWWPNDAAAGSREVPFRKQLLIERDDFAESPPDGWKRLAPGREVRLFGAYFVRCDGVERGAQGEVTGLRCTVDLHSRGGAAPDGRHPSATLHWVDARAAVPCEARLYDRLFSVEQPDAEGDFIRHLNPNSLTTATAHVEPALARAQPGDRYQFMRLGFFVADTVTSTPGAPVWNRTITLRDTWTRPADRATSQPARADRSKSGQVTAAADLEAAFAAAVDADGELRALAEGHGLSKAALGRLASDPERLQFLRDALQAGAPAELGLRWLQNEVAGALAGRPLRQLPIDPAGFAAFVRLVADGKLAHAAAKQVLGPWLARGGDAARVAAELGLFGVGASTIDVAVADVLAEMPNELSRLRAGETKLVGALLGAALRKVKGADAAQVRAALLRAVG